METEDKRIEEFMNQFKRIENDLSLLNEEKKNLFNDYKDEFEPRVLREAVRTVKARMRLGDSVSQLDQLVEQIEHQLGLDL